MKRNSSSKEIERNSLESIGADELMEVFRPDCAALRNAHTHVSSEIKVVQPVVPVQHPLWLHFYLGFCPWRT